VVSAATGAPIPAAVISVFGTRISAISDRRGNFILEAPARDVRLAVQSIGYHTAQLPVPATASNVTIELPVDVLGLDELVVTLSIPHRQRGVVQGPRIRPARAAQILSPPGPRLRIAISDPADRGSFMRNSSLCSLALLVCFALPGNAQSVRRAQAPIAVGPLVQVSKAFANLPHYESLAAGDPDHAGRLITCSTVHPTDGPRAFIIYQYCYVTFDSGRTWQPTLRSELMWGNQDPAAIYGRGDTVYVASLVSIDADKPEDPDPEKNDHTLNRTIVYRSTDGGRTWAESARFESIDREFLNVDRTNGKYGGRVYNVAQGSVRGVGGTRGPSWCDAAVERLHQSRRRGGQERRGRAVRARRPLQVCDLADLQNVVRPRQRQAHPHRAAQEHVE
jgi:hypothetical protein